MIPEYYRDLAVDDTIIVSNADGIYALDLSTLTIGSFRRIDEIPGSALHINTSDVGRAMVKAATRSIQDCERRMEEVE